MTATARRRSGSIVGTGLLAAVTLLLASCGSGTSATPDTGPSSSSSTETRPSITGPTLVVTVPELSAPTESSTTMPVAATPDPDRESGPASAAPTAPPTTSRETTEEATPEPADTEEATQPEPPPPAETTAAAAGPDPAPSGAGLNVSLANCDGCTVLATHRDVAGGRSAALVSTGSGRGILLSVGGDGRVAGVIGVPYGAAFAAPDDGVLPCAQGRCIVQGRQPDGRAILSAFELTESGAWRDVSGDDAFPSATERAAVIDLDGELAIAVQDQGDGSAVWMLYTWGADRYTVLGCAPDGDPPAAAAAVSPQTCLS